MFLYLSQTLTKAPRAPWSIIRVKGVLRPESLRTPETKTRVCDDDNARGRECERACGRLLPVPQQSRVTPPTTGEAVQLRDCAEVAISVTPAPTVQAGVCVPCRNLKTPQHYHRNERHHWGSLILTKEHKGPVSKIDKCNC